MLYVFWKVSPQRFCNEVTKVTARTGKPGEIGGNFPFREFLIDWKNKIILDIFTEMEM